MGDRNHHRDKTLILRILVPTLGSAIRDKMADLEQSSGEPEDTPKRSSDIFDLEGVTIEPAALSKGGESTRWSFLCDGAKYPARLVNLPCPVELHKTHDHVTYYKSVDVAQMLIVYEDMQALEEAESIPGYSVDGFSTYFHSGLTPPMTRVVERRFAAREHKAVAPPPSEIAQVEKEIMALIELLSKDSTKKTKSSLHSPPVKSVSSSLGTHIIQEEIEDEIVDYEPWMDNYGRIPQGIEFDERDEIAKHHPELWLTPHQYTKLLEAQNGGPTSRNVNSSTTSRTVDPLPIKSTKSTKAQNHTNYSTNASISVGLSNAAVSGTDNKKAKKKKRKEDDVLGVKTSNSGEAPKEDIDRIMQMGILQMNDEETLNYLDDLDLGFDLSDSVFTQQP